MAFADALIGGQVAQVAFKTKVTLSGTVRVGDLVGYSSGWKPALATVTTVVAPLFVALQAGVSGDVIEIASAAVVAGRLSGMTPGNPLYAGEGADGATTRGAYTETAPTTAGDVNTIIGYALSATEAFVAPSQRAASLAS